VPGLTFLAQCVGLVYTRLDVRHTARAEDRKAWEGVRGESNLMLAFIHLLRQRSVWIGLGG